MTELLQRQCYICLLRYEEDYKTYNKYSKYFINGYTCSSCLDAIECNGNKTTENTFSFDNLSGVYQTNNEVIMTLSNPNWVDALQSNVGVSSKNSSVDHSHNILEEHLELKNNKVPLFKEICANYVVSSASSFNPRKTMTMEIDSESLEIYKKIDEKYGKSEYEYISPIMCDKRRGNYIKILLEDKSDNDTIGNIPAYGKCHVILKPIIICCNTWSTKRAVGSLQLLKGRIIIQNRVVSYSNHGLDDSDSSSDNSDFDDSDDSVSSDN